MFDFRVRLENPWKVFVYPLDEGPLNYLVRTLGTRSATSAFEYREVSQAWLIVALHNGWRFC